MTVSMAINDLNAAETEKGTGSTNEKVKIVADFMGACAGNLVLQVRTRRFVGLGPLSAARYGDNTLILNPSTARAGGRTTNSKHEYHDRDRIPASEGWTKHWRVILQGLEQSATKPEQKESACLDSYALTGRSIPRTYI